MAPAQSGATFTEREVMKANRYHKRFLDSFTSENLLGLFSRYRNGHKEITESWAMLEAARKYVPVESLNKSTVIVVGDGASPRTGAVFAYYTKASVISVDPQMNMDHWSEHCQKQIAMGYPVQRLTVRPVPIEEMELDAGGQPVIVVWPHSHANMHNAQVYNYSKRWDIAMPCCKPIPKSWMTIPHLVYDDYNVLSPKRTVHIWECDGPKRR